VVNGVLLPHVIRFNAAAWPERFVALGAAAGLPTDGVPPHEVAERLADLVRALADDLGVPKSLTSLGVAEADVPVLARTTLKDACMATNPRDVDVRDVERLFREAL
jgi:1,3-propanediol dehydrogenase